MKPLLNIKNLVVDFHTEKGTAHALNNVSFQLNQGETLGVVGESGCGKSVTALAIMRLIQSPPGRIVSGQIEFKGTNLLEKSERQMRSIRGKDISMIFQEPMTALDPVFSIGNQLTSVIRNHQKLSRSGAFQLAVEMMKKVDIPEPEKRMKEHPHQLSGGMRQRVMIAMAMSCQPSLIIADEPTTALDVTVQALVLNELAELQKSHKMGIVLITHDMGVIAETCKDVIVMYCGNVVETADVRTLFRSPKHPYTVGLLHSLPKIQNNKLDKLPTIEGIVPDLLNLPKGCNFVNRCPRAKTICSDQEPGLEIQPDKAKVACFFPHE
jgi:peptide/nickel transport system ATP-binding protein